MPHLTVTIYGRVQGVFFRAAAKEQADTLGITGTAHNNPDGSVHIEAEGNRKQLHIFLDWCRTGPPLARVDRVTSSFSDAETEYQGFTIP